MEQERSTGFLHPGAMGSTIGATCGGQRWWVSDGRSDASRARAQASGLTDAGSLESLVERVDVVVSICPPAEASAVAKTVADTGYGGVYVDANAISPELSRQIGSLFERYVDGGIVGPPATAAGRTRMYLSGTEAEAVAQRWAGSLLDVRAIGEDIGAASALKMAYAGWTKGSTALLLAIASLAESNGVWEELQDEWALSLPDLPDSIQARARGVSPKAWRFEGEMREIAATFDASGLPSGFHDAATEVYGRLAGLQHESDADLARVLAALQEQSPEET